MVIFDAILQGGAKESDSKRSKVLFATLILTRCFDLICFLWHKYVFQVQCDTCSELELFLQGQCTCGAPESFPRYIVYRVAVLHTIVHGWCVDSLVAPDVDLRLRCCIIDCDMFGVSVLKCSLISFHAFWRPSGSLLMFLSVSLFMWLTKTCLSNHFSVVILHVAAVNCFSHQRRPVPAQPPRRKGVPLRLPRRPPNLQLKPARHQRNLLRQWQGNERVLQPKRVSIITLMRDAYVMLP